MPSAAASAMLGSESCVTDEVGKFVDRTPAENQSTSVPLWGGLPGPAKCNCIGHRRLPHHAQR
jgi:hypothetical protein